MNDKLFNLVEKMYIEFSGNFQKIDQRINGVEQKVGGLEQEVGNLGQKVGGLEQKVGNLEQKVGNLEQKVGKIEIMIENDMAEKIEILFDGQKQMVEQLNRIEEKVDQHDEIIIKRIK